MFSFKKHKKFKGARWSWSRWYFEENWSILNFDLDKQRMYPRHLTSRKRDISSCNLSTTPNFDKWENLASKSFYITLSHIHPKMFIPKLYFCRSSQKTTWRSPIVNSLQTPLTIVLYSRWAVMDAVGLHNNQQLLLFRRSRSLKRGTLCLTATTTRLRWS